MHRDRIDPSHARDALHAISPDLPRDEWVRVGMAAQAAGIDFEEFDHWSSGAASYDTRAVRDTWRSFRPGKGIGAGTLIRIATDAGWRPPRDGHTPQATSRQPAPRQTHQRPDRPRQGPSAADLWRRFEPATDSHPYIERKHGRPDGLRVVPAGDPLTIAGVTAAGALVVPVGGSPNEPASLQFIATPTQAAAWKEAGKPSKLNLPGARMAGAFTVGEVVPGGVVYVVEGIGQAWACWKATGCAAVVAFGWGRVRAVVDDLRQRDPSARLVLVPDAGKESDARTIAAHYEAAVVTMPHGSPPNFDANDYAQAEGVDALEALLTSASKSPLAEPRFKLLGASDLRALPPLSWRIRGVLPSEGVAAVFGASGSGKSFLALDMAGAIAQTGEGREWFGHRVKPAPVAYVVLEGEAGFRLRVAAWEQDRARPLPDGLRLVLQPFKLTEPQDVEDLAAAVLALGAGPVVFVDTLNRAAPGADENSSQDMGAIIEGAKALQRLTAGLVVLVHHSGKDQARGMRGHSSLNAALDAAIEVTRNDARREWSLSKAKDGEDGAAKAFRLEVVELGEDDEGEAVTSCVVRKDQSAEEIQRVKLPQGGNQRLVLDALRPLFKDGRTGRPGAPPVRPCIELEAAVTAGAGRLTCPTDKRTSRTRDAISGLVSRGVLGLNDGWLWLT
ncbi:MAG: AAA family ATPase [Leptothrix sp. (in: b-proteobacteria)]